MLSTGPWPGCRSPAGRPHADDDGPAEQSRGHHAARRRRLSAHRRQRAQHRLLADQPVVCWRSGGRAR